MSYRIGDILAIIPAPSDLVQGSPVGLSATLPSFIDKVHGDYRSISKGVATRRVDI
jgi:hypothetical protein